MGNHSQGLRKAWLRTLGGAMVSGAVFAATPARADDATSPPVHPVYMTGAVAVDPADYARLPSLPKFRAWFPKSIDLSDAFPRPGYQGEQSSCVAWATTYAARGYLYGRDIGKRPSNPSDEMSPGYVYGRLRPPGPACTTGISVGAALDLLTHEGAVTQADFPTQERLCPVPPEGALQATAAAYRLGGWRKIDHDKGQDNRPLVIDDIKGALNRGLPVVFVMPAMQDFTDLNSDAVYTHLVPENSNRHAMAIVGFDDDRQAFRIINSWGATWGDHGYAWIGYPTFRVQVDEAYALLDKPGQHAVSSTTPVLDPQAQFARLSADLPQACGLVRSSRNGGTLTVSGFADRADTLDALYHAALAASDKLVWQVDQHPWPQCEAELSLTDAISLGGVTLGAKREDGSARSGDPVRMKAGELFGVTATVDARRPFLSLVYLQADGSAVEMYRGMPAPGTGGRRTITLGLQGTRATRFQVGPPYGDEVVIAIASDHPLTDPALKDYQTEREFLSGLRTTLTREAKGTIAASVLRIKTTS